MRFNNFQIKLWAIVLMTLDHIGLFFPNLPFAIELRCFGRLAFPLFAFSVAEGFKHTHDLKKYFTRLFSMALIFHIFMYFFDPTMPPNVFFTLAFGLLGLIVCQNKFTAILVIPILALAYFFDTDYSWYGVAIIVVFGLVKNKYVMTSLFAAITVLYSCLAYGGDINYIQMIAIAASIFILAYDGEKGPSMKYFFYIYYPVHLVIIYSIVYFMN